jgi:uncharacterized protein DUF4333/putative VirB-like lipoprotein
MRRPILALGALAILAGCGEETIDTKDLESKLRTQLAPQGGVKPEDISVKCPDDQKVEKGHKFSCTLTAPDGSKARIDVTLTNDKGHFEAIVPKDQFEEN